VGARADLDNLEMKFLTLPGLELRPLSRPARSQSLYRLRYPGSSLSFNAVLFGRSLPMFRRNVPPPPSESTNKPNKKRMISR
jgi:hypothetical protein